MGKTVTFVTRIVILGKSIYIMPEQANNTDQTYVYPFYVRIESADIDFDDVRAIPLRLTREQREIYCAIDDLRQRDADTLMQYSFMQPLIKEARQWAKDTIYACDLTEQEKNGLIYRIYYCQKIRALASNEIVERIIFSDNACVYRAQYVREALRLYKNAVQFNTAREEFFPHDHVSSEVYRALFGEYPHRS